MRISNGKLAAIGLVATTMLTVGIVRVLARHLVEHNGVSFDVSSDGRSIVFAAADRNLYLFGLETQKVRPFTTSKSAKYDPSFSPGGKWIVYAEETGDDGGSAIILHSIKGTDSRRLTKGNGYRDSSPVFFPDGSKIVFERASRRRPYSFGGWRWDNWDLWEMNADGSQIKQVTYGRYSNLNSPRMIGEDQHVLYSADVPYNGKYFSKTNAGFLQTLLQIELSSTNPPQTVLSPPPDGLFIGAWASCPAIDHTGREVLFISDRLQPFQYDVFLWRREMHTPRPLGLTSVSRYNQNPKWLPGDKAILFLAATKWNLHSRPIYSLWQANSDGSSAHEVAGSTLFTSPRRWQSKH